MITSPIRTTTRTATGTGRSACHAGTRLPLILATIMLVGSSGARAIDTEEVRMTESGIADGAVTITRDDATDELVFTDAVAGSVSLVDLVSTLTTHGALSDLGADDHTQYHTDARHTAQHVATYNDALAVTADIAGNETIGDHLSDSTIHLRRNAPETISGLWTMTSLFECAGGLTLSDGGSPGDVAIEFARTSSPDASLAFSDATDMFTLSRPTHVANGAGAIPTETIAGATVLLVQNNATSSDKAFIALIGGDGSGANTAIMFGDDDDENSGQITYTNDSNEMRFRTNGGSTALTIDMSGNIVLGQPRITVGGVSWTSGSGSPEAVVAAPVGSIYSRTDGGAGSTLYVKEGGGSSNVGWAAK